jgi:ABC-type proline/glycine betaine transport system permease subunit
VERRAAAGAAGDRRGLRIAAVTVISVTVVAAYVNAGGLGTLIFNGIAATTRRRSGPAR